MAEIAGRVSITERAVHRIVSDLVDTGYVRRTRVVAEIIPT
jgi:DNA-binding Lrp family transcriptional regulator